MFNVWEEHELYHRLFWLSRIHLVFHSSEEEHHNLGSLLVKRIKWHMSSVRLHGMWLSYTHYLHLMPSFLSSPKVHACLWMKKSYGEGKMEYSEPDGIIPAQSPWRMRMVRHLELLGDTGLRTDFRTRATVTWIPLPALPLINYVTLGKFLYFLCVDLTIWKWGE